MGFPNAGAPAARRRTAARPRPPVCSVGVNIGRTKPPSDADADYHASVRRRWRRSPTTSSSTSARRTRRACAISGGRPARAADRGRARRRSACGPSGRRCSSRSRPTSPTTTSTRSPTSRSSSASTASSPSTRRSRGAAARARRRRSTAPAGAACPARRWAARRSRCCGGCARAWRPIASLVVASAASRRRRRAGSGSRAGATLVQAYTGFVYGGPLWPARINRGLARLVGRGRLEICRRGGRQRPSVDEARWAAGVG